MTTLRNLAVFDKRASLKLARVLLAIASLACGCIGRREQGIFPFRGVIDEIKWWTIGRSQEEICEDAGGVWNGAACAYP